MRRIPLRSSMRSYPVKPSQIATSPPLCSSALGPLKYSSMTAPIGLTEDRMSRVTAFSAGCPFSRRFLSGNTMLTLTTGAVGVGVEVGVREAVAVNVDVGVREFVAVNVMVDVW